MPSPGNHPVIYEVNVSVDATIIDAYQAWLKTHIAEILALPGFTGAMLYRVDTTDVARVELCVHYQLLSEAHLQRYLEEHAPRLRADGIARFGAHFQATRRILHTHVLS